MLRPRALALAVAAASLGAAHGAVLTWDGTARSLSGDPLTNWNATDPFRLVLVGLVPFADTNWNNDASPSIPARPANGDSLVFAGSRGLTNTNDLTGLTVKDISFAAGAGAAALGGRAITVNGTIQNESSNTQTISLPITLGSNQFWNTRGNAPLVLDGGLDVNGHSLYLRNTRVTSTASDFGVGGTLTLDASNLTTATARIGRTAGNDGTVVLSSGSTWTAGTSASDGGLLVGNGAHGAIQIGDGSSVSAYKLVLGATAGFTGSVAVLDATLKAVGIASSWQIGSSGDGSLAIGQQAAAGGTVTLSSATIGGQASRSCNPFGPFGTTHCGSWSSAVGNGVVSLAGVDGKASVLSFARTLAIGDVAPTRCFGFDCTFWVEYGSGTGTLDIVTFSTVTMSDPRNGLLRIGSQGTVNLIGGTLRVAQDRVTVDPAGVFNWQSGTLSLAGDAVLGGAFLDTVTVLRNGQKLIVDKALAVGGNALVLAGGQISAQAVSLNGGSVLALPGQASPLTSVGALSGNGLVHGPITGGTSTAITATGGTLTLGQANLPNGFAFDGTLAVAAGATAQLQSSGVASLGSLTTLADGARLASLNGTVVGTGRALSFSGNATVQGRFTNDGTVSGSGGTLAFLGDVNGGGSFGGSVAFHAGYSPGHSPASVDFGGADASFDSSAVLTLEVFGPTPGSGYDQLMGIGHLRFDGRLVLDFTGFAPATGMQFDLLGYRSFSGSLAADRITVIGLPTGQRLQTRFDASGFHGDIAAVTTVPEPATWALWLAGAGLLAARGQRARRHGPPA